MMIDNYIRSRRYLYHLTDRANLTQISETRCLLPAADWMEQAGRTDLLRTRRQNHERVTTPDKVIVIRDQAPLRRGNLLLTNGYTFEEFVESLNRRIFF